MKGISAERGPVYSNIKREMGWISLGLNYMGLFELSDFGF